MKIQYKDGHIEEVPDDIFIRAVEEEVTILEEFKEKIGEDLFGELIDWDLLIEKGKDRLEKTKEIFGGTTDSGSDQS